MKSHRVTARVTDQLYEKLQERIRNEQDEDVTVSVIIRDALNSFLSSPGETGPSEHRAIKIRREAPKIAEKDEKEALRELQQW